MFKYLLFFLTLSRLAHAIFVSPPSTSTGLIEGEIENQYQLRNVCPQCQDPLFEIDISDSQWNIPPGKKFFVDTILFQGNETFSLETLQACVEPYIHREVSLKEVYDICACVERLYAERGYFLARVYPPEQSLKNNTVCLSILEGKLGQISVEGNCYYDARFIQNYFCCFQGKTVNYNQLLRALLLLNENSDLEVGAIFRKGQERGEVDLCLMVRDCSPFHVYVDYNNYGSEIITRHRQGLRLDKGNLFFNGDTFSFIEALGLPPKWLNFSNVIYNVPLNTKGTSLEGSFLYSGFKVKEPSELDLRGFSNIDGVKLTQAVYRSRCWSLDLLGSFEYKQIKNLTLDSTSSFDKLRVAGLGATFDGLDCLCGKNIGAMTFFFGIPNFLGGLKPVDPRCSREGGGGRFYKGVFDYKRIQAIGGNCFAVGSLLGQYSWNKLPLPEQMYLGGIDTVRGYEMAAYLGDKGYAVSLETRFPTPFLGNLSTGFCGKTWNDILQWVLFVDHGGVFLNGGAAESQPGNVFLTGVGGGFRLFCVSHFDVNFDLGVPLTHRNDSNYFCYVRVGWSTF